MVILFNSVGSRIFNLYLPTSDLDVCAILKDEKPIGKRIVYGLDVHYMSVQKFINRIFDGKSSMQICSLFGEPIIQTPNSDFIIKTKDEFFDINKKFCYNTFMKIADLYWNDFDKNYTYAPKCLMKSAHYYRLLIEYVNCQDFTKAFYVPDSEKDYFLKIRKGELPAEEIKKFLFKLREKVLQVENFYTPNSKSKKYNLEWIDHFLKLADYNTDEILQNFYSEGYEIP